VFLTGRREDKKEGTVKNLERAGYAGYLKLIVKYDNCSFLDKNRLIVRSLIETSQS
jgi:hypothetical protein